MTDARLPERWLNDRRLLRLSDQEHRAYVTALLWSVSNRTDGAIQPADLELIPHFRGTATAAALVGAGLWEAVDGGWIISDFAETQSTRAQLEGLARKRAQDRERQARRRARADVTRDTRRDVTRDTRRDVTRDTRRDDPRDVTRDIPRDDPRDVTRDTKARTGQDRLGQALEEDTHGDAWPVSLPRGEPWGTVSAGDVDDGGTASDVLPAGVSSTSARTPSSSPPAPVSDLGYCRTCGRNLRSDGSCPRGCAVRLTGT